MTREDLARHLRDTLSRARLQHGQGFPMFAAHWGPGGLAFVQVPPELIGHDGAMAALGPVLADLADRMRAHLVGFVMPAMSAIEWDKAVDAADVETKRPMGRVDDQTEMVLVTVVSAAGATTWGADVMRPAAESPFLADWRQIDMRHNAFTDPIMVRLAAPRN